MKPTYFHVKNDPIGQLFISDLRIALDGAKAGGIKIHGRNANRKQFYPEKNRVVSYYSGVGLVTYTKKSSYQQDLPRKFATHFAVYPKSTAGVSITRAMLALYKKSNKNVIVS